VAGNHELYNSRHAGNWKHMPVGSVDIAQKRIDQCQRIADEFRNVHFLNRRRVDRDGVAFLGCTLWTDLSHGGAVEAGRMMNRQVPTGRHYDVTDKVPSYGTLLNDYRLIAVLDGDEKPMPITPDITSAWHFMDYLWLNREISGCEEEGRPAVVITHHLPTHDLISLQYKDHPLNAAFASHCDDLIRSPVRAWIAGHTHTGAHRTWRHEDGSVTLGVVNPKGYPGEQGTGYSREIFVDISAEPGNGGDSRDPLLVGAADLVEDVTPKRRVSLRGDDDDIEFR
jgi:hypothetical protein